MTAQVMVSLLILAVLWGSAFPAIKLGLEGFSAPHLTLARHLVASACFVPFLLLTKRRLWPERRDLGYFLLLGVCGITIYHLGLNFGEQRVSAGATSLIIATAPALTAIVAYFLIDERLPKLGWLGIAISFVGVLLIVLGDSRGLSFDPFALLILLSAVSTAFYFTLQKRLFSRYKAVEVTAFATWGGTLPLLLFLPGFPAALAGIDPTPLFATIYIGVFPSAVAYTLFSFALSQAPVTLVTAYLYTVPIFSLLLSWLILGEVPSWLTVVGGAVAIAGIVVVNRAKRTKKVPQQVAGARS